jgi:hypothetical protein
MPHTALCPPIIIINIIFLKDAYAGQLDSFTHLRALSVLHDHCNTVIFIIIVNNNHAYAGQLNRFTHLRALLVLP